MKKKKLIAYCMAEHLGQMTEEDAKCLDAVHVSFGLLKEGEIWLPAEENWKDMERLRKLHPGIRLVLSVGGWGADGFSQAAESADGRKKFADSALALAEGYGFDGIDIDWEYPCSALAGIRAVQADRDNYTRLLDRLRNTLDGGGRFRTLSVAAGAEPYFLAGTKMREAQELLDYVQLMTYDFRGGFQKRTGHHANLYSYPDVSGASADRAVQIFMEAGVPEEKLVMGAAFYGRKWSSVVKQGDRYGLGEEAATTGAAFLGYHEVEGLLADASAGWQKYRDEQAKAAWLWNGQDFISYEDAEALQKKAEYVRESNLYGLMYWEYALDSSHVLTKMLEETLREKADEK